MDGVECGRWQVAGASVGLLEQFLPLKVISTAYKRVDSDDKGSGDPPVTPPVTDLPPDLC
jgi:hypothetical protein